MHRIAWSLLALPAILWFGSALAARLVGHVPAGMSLLDGFMLASYFAMFTYVAVGLITVPLLLICASLRWVSAWHAVAVGAITGALPLLAPALSQLLDDRLHLHYRLSQLVSAVSSEFVVLGAVGGVLFWFMAVWRNPVFRSSGKARQARHGAA